MLNKRHLGFFFLLLLAICLLTPMHGSASPEPRINILSPGDNSILTSPIKLSSEIIPDPEGMIRVTLTSRSGDLLARQLIRLDSSSTSLFVLDTDLAFEIPSDQTEALLTLAVQDAYFRTIAVRSVLVILASTGEPALVPAVSMEPWVEITQPQPMEEVSGGEFSIIGRVAPVSESPITFELISDSGRVVGSTQLQVDTSGEWLDFKIRLNYTYITESTGVRLIIRQNCYPYNEIMILDSLQLTAAP